MPGNTEQTLSDQHQMYQSMHASAGSGKTYQLVSQIVRLLLLGAEPASILAITFTRKAAAEMQERLLTRVYELATASDTQLDKKITELDLKINEAHRSSARNLYETLLHTSQGVRTTTFHAFCQDLLRRFPMEAEIPPGFELVERTGYLIDLTWQWPNTSILC
jgi:ATP-dependent helicase/nuclease subunit A